MGLHEEAGTHRRGGTVCPASVGNPPRSRGGGCQAGDPDFRFICEDHVLAHDADLKRAAADGLQHSGAVRGADRLEIAADGSASRKTRNRSARPPGARAAGLSKKRVLDRVGDEQVAKMGRRDGRFLDLGKGRLNNGRA